MVCAAAMLAGCQRSAAPTSVAGYKAAVTGAPAPASQQVNIQNQIAQDQQRAASGAAQAAQAAAAKYGKQ